MFMVVVTQNVVKVEELRWWNLVEWEEGGEQWNPVEWEEGGE